MPITREQRHIWLDLTRTNDGLAYHEPMIARFEGHSTPEIIARSLEQVPDDVRQLIRERGLFGDR